MRTSILSDWIFSRHGTLASSIRRAVCAAAVAVALAVPFAPMAAPAQAIVHAPSTHLVADGPNIPCPATGGAC